VPLKLKPTDWESVFRSAKDELQTRSVRLLLERRTKSHTGRRADCDSCLQVRCSVPRARGSGRQRATPAPGEQAVQFTAPSKELQVANRVLGTVEHVNSDGDLGIRMDSGQEVRVNIREQPHLDFGYAVTSHSSQGQTADRVLVHVDTEMSELLVNNRFAYVSVSRAQHDAHICTNDGSKLPRSLGRESSQRTATEVEQELATPKTESVSQRGGRPSEEEQGHSLGIGLA